MERFLIEVSHKAEKIACARAVKLLISTGSHFLTHADWGCRDGEHKGWITIDAESKEEVRSYLPPEYRSIAKIVNLNKFTLEEINDILDYHTL